KVAIVLRNKDHRVMATLEHFNATADPDKINAILERDGAVVIENLLTPDIVARVNDEVEDAVAVADPDEQYFNPLLTAFFGAYTKQVAGVPGISRTFATDVMCNPVLLALCDGVLLPSCARYQLNLGHLLQRGPGSIDQIWHRDEAVWNDVPRPHPELQVAS